MMPKTTYREIAERVFFGSTLNDKLTGAKLVELIDEDPGRPVDWRLPQRSESLKIAPRRSRKRLPHPDSLVDNQMRIRCLHTFANHELMALELMAWALLRWPEAPASFRRGLMQILLDEERHLRMYCDRMEALGASFGDLALNDHFFRCAESLTSPLRWVCAVNLTFEQANLDFAPRFARYFERVEDVESAQLMRTIALDEIAHVGFGASYLKENLEPGASAFQTYRANLSFHNDPSRARGEEFQADARRMAGLDEDFILRVAGWSLEDIDTDDEHDQKDQGHGGSGA